MFGDADRYDGFEVSDVRVQEIVSSDCEEGVISILEDLKCSEVHRRSGESMQCRSGQEWRLRRQAVEIVIEDRDSSGAQRRRRKRIEVAESCSCGESVALIGS